MKILKNLIIVLIIMVLVILGIFIAVAYHEVIDAVVGNLKELLLVGLGLVLLGFLAKYGNGD